MLEKDTEDAGVLKWTALHEGRGTVGVKHFFGKNGPAPLAAHPAILMLLTLPPGSSEGMHAHEPGNAEAGSFDEFYYVISGRGQMLFADQVMPVRAGDQVFAPNGLAHGLENASDTDELKVYLVAIER